MQFLFVTVLSNILTVPHFSSILKGSDDAVMHFEESCFRTLSIVQCFPLKTTFRKLALLPSSGKNGGKVVEPTLCGPLERASLNHWTSCF
jgi:hypothetical protein